VSEKPLSARAKHRLDIAASLLRSMGRRIDSPPNRHYETVQEVLSGLPESRRAMLREATDWVEQYDLAEASYTKVKRASDNDTGRRSSKKRAG
jgi:hypothetical protein